MIGYYPIKRYASLAGISLDTAWHRVLRGAVPSIVDSTGVRYVRFDDNPIPDTDAYLPIKDWCEKNGVPRTTMLGRISKGLICEPDFVQYKDTDKQTKYYIQKDYQMPDLKQGPKLIAPDGYMTMKEFAKKHRLKYDTVRAYARKGSIPSIVIDEHRFIPSDAPVPKIQSYNRKNDK